MAEQSELERARKKPRRFINKQQAIRHLLHSAIRLIMNEEDPFAAHLIIHSADKLILDIAKSRGVYPKLDWELYIKDEYQKEFFKQHRETYNYFKHANKDFAEDLPVHDIMTLNVMTLLSTVTNYSDLFRERTDHMNLFTVFVMTLSPAIIGANFPHRDEMLKAVRDTQTATPREFFKLFEEHYSATFPKFFRERSEDLQDIGHFYSLTFSELRAGVTENPRIRYLEN